MFSPYIALLPAQTHEMSAHLRDSNFAWFARRNISVHDKQDYWLLNKDSNSEVNHWNRLCQSTVYKKNGILFSLPVIKPAKLGSDDCAIQYANSDLVQKIGGETINVFWPYNTVDLRVYHTEDKISSNEEDFPLNSPRRNAKNEIKKLEFSHSDMNNIYTFQFWNNELYLVAIRYSLTLSECTEEEMDFFAKKLKVKRPRIFYKCSSWTHIQQLLNENNNLFMLRDRKTGERANAHLQIRRSKVIGRCKYKRLLPYWINDTHEHVVDQFPQTESKYDEINKAVRKLKDDVIREATKWKHLRLENVGLVDSLKLSVVPQILHKIIIRLQNFNEERWDEIVMDWFHKMQAKQLISILGLKDED